MTLAPDRQVASAGRAPTCRAVVVAVEELPCSQHDHMLASINQATARCEPLGGWKPTNHLHQAAPSCKEALQLPRWGPSRALWC